MSRQLKNTREFDEHKRALKLLIDIETDSQRKAILNGLLENLDRLAELTEEFIRDAENVGVRFPDFDGDMVGYIDDDDDDDDEIDPWWLDFDEEDNPYV